MDNTTISGVKMSCTAPSTTGGSNDVCTQDSQCPSQMGQSMCCGYLNGQRACNFRALSGSSVGGYSFTCGATLYSYVALALVMAVLALFAY